MQQGGTPLSGLWVGPAMFGMFLVFCGILIFLMPQLLAYIVGFGLIVAGVGMIAMGMASRAHVSYHQIDESRID
ncbi:MAG: DUF3096 domain-containing protein [Planctomycetia bacterium]|nr:MAG: DUF3096 domain-containing protein [Planctomycetia bacterium]